MGITMWREVKHAADRVGMQLHLGQGHAANHRDQTLLTNAAGFVQLEGA